MEGIKLELTNTEYQIIKKYREMKPREKITITKQSQDKRIKALIHHEYIDIITDESVVSSYPLVNKE